MKIDEKITGIIEQKAIHMQDNYSEQVIILSYLF